VSPFSWWLARPFSWLFSAQRSKGSICTADHCSFFFCPTCLKLWPWVINSCQTKKIEIWLFFTFSDNLHWSEHIFTIVYAWEKLDTVINFLYKLCLLLSVLCFLSVSCIRKDSQAPKKFHVYFFFPIIVQWSQVISSLYWVRGLYAFPVSGKQSLDIVVQLSACDLQFIWISSFVFWGTVCWPVDFWRTRNMIECNNWHVILMHCWFGSF
jgi:hypothetical protein